MTWDSLPLPWQACLEEAWVAYCAGSVPIGAVIADAEGRIVARGRNRSAEDCAEIDCFYNHRLAHAEMNALIALDYREHDPPHSLVLYATTEPCPLCFGAFYMSGVRELRYASRDPYAGSVNLLGTTPYLRRKPIRIVPPQIPELERLIVAMFAESRFSSGDTLDNIVLSAYAQMLPQAIEWGKTWAETGQLRRLKESGAPIAEVVDRLTREELLK